MEISSCPDLSVHEGMSPELLCCARSTISEGQFMWSYEQNSSYQAVAIRDGATLQETFRKKIYDKDKARGILSNNLTINEKFYGRVNITYDGNLILMNSTVQDSGNYKCSYQGITGPVEESLLKLSVKPFNGRTKLSFVTPVWQVNLYRACFLFCGSHFELLIRSHLVRSLEPKLRKYARIFREFTNSPARLRLKFRCQTSHY